MIRKISFLSICSILLLQQASATVVTYPAPEGAPVSTEYSLKVNGQPVHVYQSPIVSYGVFDTDQKVEVSIRANRDVKWVDVRPRSLGIKPQFKDSLITFTLPAACNVSVELNGSLSHPLFIFANPLEKNKPSKTDPNVIWFEAGKIHTPGVIEVKSNQTVYIEGGAMVQGVVYAKDATNVRVCGRGIMDGTNNRKNMERPYHRFLQFVDCSNVKIEDIILHNGTTWQVVPMHCDGVNISNIKIFSDNGGDDGMDIVRCKNVVIDGCFVRTKDDCIAIKSFGDYPGNHPTDNLLIKNCTFWNALWGNAIEIGFELRSDEVKNIRFENMDIIHVEAGAAISIHNDAVAKVHNVVFDNIRIEDARQKLFDLAIFRSQYSIDGLKDKSKLAEVYQHGPWDGLIIVPADKREYHAQYRGHIENIVFRNIQIVDGLFPYSVFCGYDSNHMVKNVRIENLTVHGKKIKNLNEARLTMVYTEGVTIR